MAGRRAVLLLLVSFTVLLCVEGKSQLNDGTLNIKKFVRDASISEPLPSPEDYIGSGDCGCGCYNGTDGKDGKDGKNGSSIVGDQGPPGPPGPPGDNGKDGRNGVDGKEGARGEKGDQGVQGPRGAPGVCDQQSLDKINQQIQDMGAKLSVIQSDVNEKYSQLDNKLNSAIDVLTYQISLLGTKTERNMAKLKAAIQAVNDSRIPGPPGPPGPQGNQGLRGPIGPKGQIGLRGKQGITGLQGLRGQTGVTGPKGDSGISALNGCQHLEKRAESYGSDVETSLTDSKPDHVIVAVTCSSSRNALSRLIYTTGTAPYSCSCSRSKGNGSNSNFVDNAKRIVKSPKHGWGGHSRRRRYRPPPPQYSKITCVMHYWECPSQ